MRSAFLGLFCAAAAISGAHATTVSWFSEILSSFHDSNGNPLDETYTIQLGFFEDALGESFTPGSDNVSEWVQQWRVFDQASLNLGEAGGYFSAEANLNADGSSSSTYADLGLNFQGQEAYIWIRKGDEPVPGTEWFLAGAPSWTFPAGSDNCCDPTLPVQWSISDLYPETGGSVTPVWGSQSGLIGSGSYTQTDSGYTLQTFTFVPEPSSLLLALTGCLLLMRRRRDA